MPQNKKMSPVTVLYPGSFDPLTNGHLDIIQRASRIFERVIVSVLSNAGKNPLFSTKERIEMIRDVTVSLKNVKVQTFDGLLVDFALVQNVKVILRGIRAITDYDYEFQMALMNRHLSNDIETVFMVPSLEYSYLSSSLIKEVCLLKGTVAGLVPASIEKQLLAKIRTQNKNVT